MSRRPHPCGTGSLFASRAMKTPLMVPLPATIHSFDVDMRCGGDSMAVGVRRSVSFVVSRANRGPLFDARRQTASLMLRAPQAGCGHLPVPVEHPDTGSSQDAEGEVSG